MAVLTPTSEPRWRGQNRIADAMEHLRVGAELSSESADAHNNYGLALAMTGHWSEAISELERAVELSQGREPMILDLLGVAYARTGQSAKAADTTRRAASAAQARGQMRLAQELLRKAAAY